MPTLPNHTPEPWQQHDDHPVYGPDYANAVWTSKGPGYGTVCRCAPYTTATPESAANAKRIVACVNALAGVDDPAAALAEVRATMRGVLTMLEDCADGRDPASNDYIACQNLRAALALLDPTTAR